MQQNRMLSVPFLLMGASLPPPDNVHWLTSISMPMQSGKPAAGSCRRLSDLQIARISGYQGRQTDTARCRDQPHDRPAGSLQPFRRNGCSGSGTPPRRGAWLESLSHPDCRLHNHLKIRAVTGKQTRTLLAGPDREATGASCSGIHFGRGTGRLNQQVSICLLPGPVWYDLRKISPD